MIVSAIAAWMLTAGSTAVGVWACQAPLVCRRIDGVTEQDILDRGIELIAISFVDGAGLTRAKSITAARAEAATRLGLGAFQVAVDHHGRGHPGHCDRVRATGDARLLPDLDRLAGGIDGWGWAQRVAADLLAGTARRLYFGT
jgi:hypothetical protein